MAAKKKPSAEPTETGAVFANPFDAIDGVLAKLCPESSLLSESALSVISSYISTGSDSLNLIISGSTEKGIPSGRIVGYAGESSCGKTLMLCNYIAEAQKQGRFVVVFDSESAFDKQTAVNMGCDPTRIKHVPVGTIEQCRNAMVSTLDEIIKNPSLKGKFAFALDSLGNLASEKEMSDAAANKNASDMGLRAKVTKSWFRIVTYKLAVADAPFVFSNHVYADPAAMYESVKKNQAGGSGPEYMATVLVQFAATQDKSTEEGAAPALSKEVTKGAFSGISIKALTVKNRIIPPFQEAEMSLTFANGFDKRAGLVSIAKALGIVGMKGAYCHLIDDEGESIQNLGYERDIKQNKAVWPNLIARINEEMAKQAAFSTGGPTIETFEDDDSLEEASATE